MANNYLISVEDLKKKGLIHTNADTKLLKVSIKRVQDMNIQPAISSNLYRQMLSLVESDPTGASWDADYRTLQNDYIIPALVAQVDYKVALYNLEKIRNKGTGRNVDDNFQANTDDSNIAFRDELKKDAFFYMENLIKFIKLNCDIYTEYTDPKSDTLPTVDKDKTGYKTNWIV